MSYGDALSYAQRLQLMSSTQAFTQRSSPAGYLDEHGTPCDFASRPHGTSAPVLGLSQVQRAMAKIEAVEKQKAAFPPRSAAAKRPRARSPSPELDISDEDEPEGESALVAIYSMPWREKVPHKGSDVPVWKLLAAISVYRHKDCTLQMQLEQRQSVQIIAVGGAPPADCRCCYVSHWVAIILISAALTRVSVSCRGARFSAAQEEAFPLASPGCPSCPSCPGAPARCPWRAPHRHWHCHPAGAALLLYHVSTPCCMPIICPPNISLGMPAWRPVAPTWEGSLPWDTELVALRARDVSVRCGQRRLAILW